VHGWLAEQINLLLNEATSLEILTVSVMDASENVSWASKRTMLAPLKKMEGMVRFRVGEVVATDEEEADLKEQLAAYVKELNKAVQPGLPS
jgi:hypothetical protein